MSFVKEEIDSKSDDKSFINCSSSKAAFMDEDDDSQEEDVESHLSLTYTGKNAKATLSDRLTYRLIKEYKCRPCLWQKEYEGDKSFTSKQKAFEEIAQALNLSSDLVKEKLRTLRVIFYQNVKKAAKKKVGFRGNGFQPRWRFYKPMLFLVEGNLQKSDTETANSNQETNTVQFQAEIEQDLNDGATQDFHMSTLDNTIISKEEEDCSEEEQPSMEEDHLSDEQQAIYRYPRSKKTPSMGNFGKYVSLTLAQIDDEVILKRAKYQIQLVLSAAITEHAKKNLSTISSINGRKFRE